MPSNKNAERVTRGKKPLGTPGNDGHYEPATEGPTPKGSPVELSDETVSMDERNRELDRVDEILRRFKVTLGGSITNSMFPKQRMSLNPKEQYNKEDLLAFLYDRLMHKRNEYKIFLRLDPRLDNSSEPMSREEVNSAKAAFDHGCEFYVTETLKCGLGDDLHWSQKILNLLKELANYVTTKVTGNKNQFFTIEKTPTVKAVEVITDALKEDGKPESSGNTL